ncbi:HDOD domain-containing protein [Aquabacterium sp.]|uniref:HDOD domain-containing protein n=1 Tax=Aquabacterium sp. TaxID=1872578 RepID=UPI002C5F0AEC|nr:HDOD domain-containing protein [Aquabacterium sp.]HSW04476.1 HDOD domain-containing protein [Aquabacterium sp.]
MNLNTTIDRAAAVPRAASAAPASEAAGDRVGHLFRALTRAGLVHPLQPLVLQYRLTDPASGRAGRPEPKLGRGDPHAPDTPSPRIEPAQLLQRIQALPALPRAAMEALAALRDDNSSPEQCAHRIGQDQALAARTLRLANSAFYGLAGRVGSVRDAVTMLGRRTLCSTVTAAVVCEQIHAERCEGFDFAEFWRHAAGTAIAARSLARMLRLDEETAFTAGLLHDIGRLALAAYFPEQFGSLLRSAHADDQPVHCVEERLSDLGHAELGALVITQWRLPPAVAAAVRYHHKPPLPTPAGGPRPTRPAPPDLADVVHAADAIAHALDLSGSAFESVPEIDLASWGRLGIKPAQLLPIFRETEEGVAALSEALGL